MWRGYGKKKDFFAREERNGENLHQMGTIKRRLLLRPQKINNLEGREDCFLRKNAYPGEKKTSKDEGGVIEREVTTRVVYTWNRRHCEEGGKSSKEGVWKRLKNHAEKNTG